ncbi:MAG: multiheme c-type cytochrome [Candidatus Coatesbacteria bacterium]
MNRTALAVLSILLVHPACAAKNPDPSQACVECHAVATPGIIEQWKASGHAKARVGCLACHAASAGEPDAFEHNGGTIATIVTPRDCARCHARETAEFEASHHAAAGNILASLDNRLAEIVEGARLTFNPHSATPGRPEITSVNGMASVSSGCRQCHGGKVGLLTTDGKTVTADDFKPGPDGRPTAADVLRSLARGDDGRPKFDSATWPNTGIGRINLDGSRGSCSACHSRHDFSARRARQPENCGKCHLGPDHPQKEIYDESKHGVAFRDLREKMHLDAKSWVLGKDYTQAPTCATCHMSGNANNNGRVTHDPGERISWTNRPPLSLAMDTDTAHRVVTETDPVKRKALIVDTWQQKRDRMREVCSNCHSPGWIDGFYRQYDDLIVLFNEKFSKAGSEIMAALREAKLLTPAEFDEPIEWTWYYLWHHEGRRARHGASMMAPDYTHWHGMYEVADRFYVHLIPEARELAKGNAKVNAVIDAILARPEHAWGQPAAPKK